MAASKPRWISWLWPGKDGVLAFMVAAAACAYYAWMIPTEITFGDGPELLVAAHNLGVPHPSGYPLFSILGAMVSRLPGMTPFFHVALWLSAVPTALAAGLIFGTTRHLQVARHWGVLAALVWASSSDVVYQATRIEIYGLHCFFVALALWSVTRFARKQKSKWVVVAVVSVCLGLTNHLTTAFLIVPIMLGLTLIGPRIVWRPRMVITMVGVAVACSAVYLYLPIAAMTNDGTAIVWNDPQTWDRFVFHVTGAEYSIFRSNEGVWKPLYRFGNTVASRFFPGALVFVGLGLCVWGRRQWRTLVTAAGYAMCLLAYITTFRINDIATYYTSLYILVALGLALAVDGVVRWTLRWKRVGNSVQVCSVLAGIALVAYLSIQSWEVQFRERLAQDMGEEVMRSLRDPAILFTSVDGHTFPMWYQSFMVAPERKVAVVDRVLFRLDNKQWYRDFMRRTYPDVVWPDDAAVQSGGWEAEIVRNNPKHHIAGLLHQPWSVAGTHSSVRGWHHDIVLGPRSGRPPATKHIYTVRGVNTDSGIRFLNAARTYPASGEGIACTVEWHGHGSFQATWVFHGPEGQAIEVGPRSVPKGVGSSWEFLSSDQQSPGSWRCEVTRKGHPPLVTEFVVTPAVGD